MLLHRVQGHPQLCKSKESKIVLLTKLVCANSEFIHECPSCPRRYKHLNNLRRHEAVCKGQPMVDDTQWKKTLDGRYHCTYPGCAVAADQPDKNWATLQGVQQHYNQVHARPEDLQYPCDLCQIKFSSKNLLNYHRKVKHSLSSAGKTK